MKTSGALPNVTFHLRERCLDSREENPFRWVLKTSEALFAGKTVIIVGVPGAFTPTCTANHIPRFEMLHEQFMAEGVDEIFCTAVNDAFVMRQWALSIDIGRVQMLPDGNGTFARRMGALVGKNNRGFGARSWRYALLAKDSQITTVFAEEGLQDDAVEDPFERSDADAMLAYLRGETPGGVVSATRAFSG